MEMGKKCVKIQIYHINLKRNGCDGNGQKMCENPNIPYPQCERSIKISVFKQHRVPNKGTQNAENGGNWGEIRGKFAWRSRRVPSALTYSSYASHAQMEWVGPQKLPSTGPTSKCRNARGQTSPPLPCGCHRPGASCSCTWLIPPSTHPHTIVNKQTSTTRSPSVNLLLSWPSNKTEHVRRQ